MSKVPDLQLAQQWRDRLRRFDHSQLTVAEFCRLEEYSVASFYYWRRRFQSGQRGERSGTFVPVDLPATTPRTTRDGGLQIELPGGAVIRLDHEATDEQQRRLIKNVVETLSEVAS
jgi:transposase-like protein